MSTKLKAFSHGITKARFLEELNKYYEENSFVQGTFYDEETSKGCAIGCSIKSINDIQGSVYYTGAHGAYEAIGVPAWLAFLEDTIFENLDIEDAKKWPMRFSEAINPGAELDSIKDALFEVFSDICPWAINSEYFRLEVRTDLPAILDFSHLRRTSKDTLEAADLMIEHLKACKSSEA